MYFLTEPPMYFLTEHPMGTGDVSIYGHSTNCYRIALVTMATISEGSFNELDVWRRQYCTQL